MKQKKTVWYPENTKPARDGVYEVVGPLKVVMYARFWNWEWMYAFPWFDEAAECEVASLRQDKKWRGLAEKPD
jgi:hypothetical protein